MCDPVTAGAAMGGLQLIQTMSGISDQNRAAKRNARAAGQAQADETDQTTASYIEQQRGLLQGSFDAILEGRANEATAYTSAVENGVQGASVRAMLRDRSQKAGRNKSRAEQEMGSLRAQTGASYKHIRSKAKGRINSVSPTKFGLGDAAGILAPIVSSQMD